MVLLFDPPVLLTTCLSRVLLGKNAQWQWHAVYMSGSAEQQLLQSAIKMGFQTQCFCSTTLESPSQAAVLMRNMQLEHEMPGQQIFISPCPECAAAVAKASSTWHGWHKQAHNNL